MTRMKSSFFIVCLFATTLILALVVPVAAAPSISSISPLHAYNGAKVTGVIISGSGFNVTTGSVRLRMSGETNISATITASSATSLTCTFPISGAETGDWDVVVINRDRTENVLPDGFTILSAITLTSLSPAYAQTNNDSVKVTVVGTGLSDIGNLYLYNSDYDNITANIDDTTSTKVIGTFDLTDAKINSYKICVEDSYGGIKCGLNFDVLSDKVGSVDVESSPSGAKVYLDSDYVGTTPYTIEDVTLGSHKITVSKTGYVDYIKWVTVKVDSTSSVSANLDAVAASATTNVPTVATTKTPLKVTTVKVPTSWPTPATTQTPLDATLVLGAIALGVLVFYRK
jgi:hypothetical protein